jgi:hypothetical protein
MRQVTPPYPAAANRKWGHSRFPLALMSGAGCNGEIGSAREKNYARLADSPARPRRVKLGAEIVNVP